MTDGPRLAIAIASGETPPEAMAWLRQGFRIWLAGDAPLDVALGLHSTGRVRARNQALIRAAAILAEGRGVSQWDLAGELSRYIRWFQATRLVQLRRGVADVQTFAPLESALAEAFAVCPRALTCREKLYALLTDHAPEIGHGSADTLEPSTLTTGE